MAAPTLAWPAWSAPSLGVTGAVLLITVGAMAAALLKERLVLLLGAGLVGYGSAVLFLFAGAPDVAFTQVVVETVFVIVVAAVLLALKRRDKAMSVAEPALRPLALVLSLAFATVLTGLLLAAVAVPFDDSVSRWFGAHSVPAARGRNVVNVILVDFRALDTLGEITVVMLSLLAAVPLLRAVRRRGDPEDGP
jgi:multicomponent Na+:H+ antiporter subunit A